MAQVEKIIHEVRIQGDRMADDELQRLGQSLGSASREGIRAKVDEMAKHHHVHLQNIVELFIISMRNLSQGLKSQFTVVKPSFTAVIPNFTTPLLTKGSQAKLPIDCPTEIIKSIEKMAK